MTTMANFKSFSASLRAFVNFLIYRKVWPVSTQNCLKKYFVCYHILIFIYHMLVIKLGSGLCIKKGIKALNFELDVH